MMASKSGYTFSKFNYTFSWNIYQEEDCEKAYFKMDNVLIDDRRIHVDFSQSVAKVKWKGKGNKMYKLFLLIFPVVNSL